MKTMIAGITGWARMDSNRSQELRVVDTGLTALGTLLVIVTVLLLQG